jgi:hypothetical protein
MPAAILEPSPETPNGLGVAGIIIRSNIMFFLLSLGGVLVYLNIRENFNMAFFLGASAIFLTVATTGSTRRRKNKL